MKVITVLENIEWFWKKEGTYPVHILKSADSPDQAEVVHCTGPSSRCQGNNHEAFTSYTILMANSYSEIIKSLFTISS